MDWEAQKFVVVGSLVSEQVDYQSPRQSEAAFVQTGSLSVAYKKVANGDTKSPFATALFHSPKVSISSMAGEDISYGRRRYLLGRGKYIFSETGLFLPFQP